MQRLISISKNVTLFVLFLTTFLFVFESRLVLPAWLQVAGRLHPLLLHVPIGVLVLSVLLLLIRSQFKPKQFARLLSVSLTMASLTAAFTALFGLLLSVGGDYGADALSQHRNSGLVFGWLTYRILLLHQYPLDNIVLKNTAIVLSFILLLFVGHTGSVLTHGENFVLAPLQSNDEEVDPEKASLYQLAVMPVLDKKCFSCHNESKAKGELIMTSIDKFKKGGENGVVWIAGNPDSSRMMQYIHLPLEHDDHMPPDGKPQLSEFEVKLLEAWIASGADFKKRMSEFAPEDTLVTLAQQVVNSKSSVAKSEYSFKSASADLIAKLNTPFRTVFPLHLNSPALQVDFFVKEFFQLSALDELKQIDEQLVSLSLSKMPVSDDDLKILSSFKNLETLNLNFTNVTGPGLTNLKSCEKLKSISLSGTKVTVDALKPVLELPNVHTIYIWNTGISESEKAEVEKSRPDVKFVHTLFKDESVLALSKPILTNEGVLKAADKIELKHTMPGVTIRYTIDGTMPDSVHGVVYKEPIAVNETVKLQAVACKEGWYCSKAFETTVFKAGHKPVQAELLSLADKKYPGEGVSSLTDSQKGFADNFKEPSWLGFRDNSFEAGFDFGSSAPPIAKIVLSYGDNLGAYIFPPTEIEVWAGSDKNNLKLVKAEKLTVPTAYRTPLVGFIPVDLSAAKHSYYKVIARPINKLPQWHGGKGQKGWFFVDEVFFY